MSAKRKQSAVLRLLRGDDRGIVSRELGARAAELAQRKSNGRVDLFAFLELQGELADQGLEPRVLALYRPCDILTHLSCEICSSEISHGRTRPARAAGVALVLPTVSAAAMQAMLDELSQAVSPGAHAVVLMDRAGWPIAKDLAIPANLTPLFLPPYAPELNAIERVCLYLRERFLSHHLWHGDDGSRASNPANSSASVANRPRDRPLSSLV
jgi:hypothetical protein